jgi:signal peptidase I
MSERGQRAPGHGRRGLETVRAFGLAILIALAIRSFLFEPFTIPSGSMIPTLLVGDFILVNKFTYGVRLPITGTLLAPVGEPRRGDVIVFRFPDDRSQDFIKRVVGVGGDRVEIRDGRVFVNAQPIDRVDEGDYRYYDVERGRDLDVHRYREATGSGSEYTVIHNGSGSAIRQRGPWVVPEGHYFMMGDNRDNSRDSRSWRNPFVRAKDVKGRAMFVHWSWVVSSGRPRDMNPIFSLLDTLWRVVTFQVEDVRWERVGRSVHGTAD